MENHGMPFNRRWKVLRERVLAMKTIWTKDEPSFHGEFVKFDPLWSYPKPVQKPHPPIIMGSIKPQGLQRIVDYCDGWCQADSPAMERRVDRARQKVCGFSYTSDALSS